MEEFDLSPSILQISVTWLSSPQNFVAGIPVRGLGFLSLRTIQGSWYYNDSFSSLSIQENRRS